MIERDFSLEPLTEAEVSEGIVVIDGKYGYTKGELSTIVSDIEGTKKNLLKDYHEKTQLNAAERRRVEEEKERVAKEMEQIASSKAALEKDIAFYKNHPVEEWDSYKGALESSVPTNAHELKELKALKDELAAVKDKLNSIETSDVKREADKSIEYMESLKSKFPLMDVSAVKDKMYVFYHQNRRIPTRSDIEAMVKDSHFRTENLVAAKKEAEKKASILPPSGSPSGQNQPFFKKEEIKSLHDIEGAVEAGTRFFEREKTLRG